MLSISFPSAVLAITQIFAMGAVGFWLVKRGIVNDVGLKMLSFISINVAFPMFIFYQILKHFNPAQTPLWWSFPLINMALILVGLTIAGATFWITRTKIKDEVLAVSSLHNAGFIPLLLAMTLPLGNMAGKVYTAIILSIIGFDLCLWSIGLWLLTRSQNPKINLKNLLNPPLISMALAVVIVLIFGPIAINEVLMKPVKIMGDVAIGLSMIIIGGNLALTRLTKFYARGLLGAIILKTMALPTIALIVISMLKLDAVTSFVVLVQASMPTAITLSIIGRHHNTPHQDFVNTCVFLTHVICVITLPIFLGLYGFLVHL